MKKTNLNCLRCKRKGHKVRDCKIPRRKRSQAQQAGSTGSESQTQMTKLPREQLEQQVFELLERRHQEKQRLANRWDEVHFIMRGYREVPCKTRSQNPKYYDAFFICGFFDHHSHRFCKYCKTMTHKLYPDENTPCKCIE